MSTLTIEEQQRIADWLEAHPVLSVGVGDEESACSIAAINLALSGRLTDEVPTCMSEVVGRWIIAVQDRMPAEIRNSPEWRGLLPLAAGTGRDREQERLNILLDWMWGMVLPSVQPVADSFGFGTEWSAMLVQRSVDAAEAAWDAAWKAAWAAEDAARVADAPYPVADAPYPVTDAVWAATRSADAAEAGAEGVWHTFDPIGVLQRLIDVEAGHEND